MRQGFTLVELSIVLVILGLRHSFSLWEKVRMRACRLSALTRLAYGSSTSPNGRGYAAAFSLVELSIVLVILGLLTGGILTGQNLIRAAELRSVITQYQNFQTAVQTFRGKYFYLPGDIPNAHQFWGSAGGSGVIGDGCESATGSGTETCSGDGDGLVELATAGNRYAERYTMWQHLVNAGLMEGSFTGKSDVNAWYCGGGTNLMGSKLSPNAGWGITPSANVSGDTGRFDGNYGAELRFGTRIGTSACRYPVIRPQEMWSIDTKIDDGLPALGNVSAYDRVGCTLKSDGSAMTTAAGDAALMDADTIWQMIQFYAPFPLEILCSSAQK